MAVLSLPRTQFYALLLCAALAAAGTGRSIPAWSGDTEPSADTGAPDDSSLQPVLWVSNLYAEHSFWSEHLRFTRAAARDLGYRLEPVFLNQSQIAYHRLFEGLAAAGDYAGVILPSMKNQSSFIIEQVKEQGIPTVSNVVPMDFDTVGQPDPDTAWIAELRPDEVANGATLLRHLVRDARQRGLAGDGGRVAVVAVAGSRTDSVGQARLRGFQDAAVADGSVDIRQVFHSEHWSRTQSQRIMQTALQRYKDTTVIWSANDDIAIGVLAAIRNAGRDPAREFAVGGIDATPEMLDLIRRGEASVTIAGLSLHGAWSLILLHDHLQGGKLASGSSATFIGSDIVDQSNVERYISLFKADADALDFSAVATAAASNGPDTALRLDTLFAQRALMTAPK